MTSSDDVARSLLGERDIRDVQNLPDASVRISELYRIYVELMDRTTARRQTASSFFVSLNAALLTLGSLTNVQGIRFDQRSATLASAVAGIIASILWWRIIRSYGELNGARFQVIGEIERLLPIRPFSAEWEALTQRGRGFVPFSSLEQAIPIIFIALHVLAVILRIVNA